MTKRDWKRGLVGWIERDGCRGRVEWKEMRDRLVGRIKGIELVGIGIETGDLVSDRGYGVLVGVRRGEKRRERVCEVSRWVSRVNDNLYSKYREQTCEKLHGVERGVAGWNGVIAQL